MTSTNNGLTWQYQVASVQASWNSVTYGKGLFVAVGRQSALASRIMTSPDGVTWTTRVLPIEPMSLWGVTFANDMFVAIGGAGDSQAQTSTDGIHWSMNKTQAIGLRGMGFGKPVGDQGMWVGVGGSNGVMSAPMSDNRADVLVAGEYVQMQLPSAIIPTSFTWTATNVAEYVVAGSLDAQGQHWTLLSRNSTTLKHGHGSVQQLVFIVTKLTSGQTSASLDNIVVTGYPALSETTYIPQALELGPTALPNALASTQLLVNGFVRSTGTCIVREDAEFCRSVGVATSTAGPALYYRQVKQPCIWRTTFTWLGTDTPTAGSMSGEYFMTMPVTNGPYVASGPLTVVHASNADPTGDSTHIILDVFALNTDATRLSVGDGQQVGKISFQCTGSPGATGPRKTNVVIIFTPL